MASRYKEINLETDLASEKSVFKFHKALFALRKSEEVLRQGTFIPLHKAEDNFAAYIRELDGQRICVVCNFDGTTAIDLPEAKGEILLSNYGRTEGDECAFRPYEIAVYRMQ
jgi:oligo-1,6-glucosidase